MASVDYFLRIDGIDGESTAAGFAGWIDVESFSWGVTNIPNVNAGGGGAVGKALAQDLVIVKRVDKASPKLFLACANGQQLTQVTLVGRRSNSKQAYLEYKLSIIVIITSLKDAGTEGDAPLEEATFVYEKAEMSYMPTLANGQPGPVVRGGWDFVTNKPV